MTSIPLSDMEGGGNAVKWGDPATGWDKGEKHGGDILNAEWRNQTDPNTGQPKKFPSGDPMKQLVITIDEGGEKMALYAGGGNFTATKGEGQSMLNAIVTAVKTADCKELSPGGRIVVAFTGRTDPVGAKSPARLYRAQYRPPQPGQGVKVDDLFNEE